MEPAHLYLPVMCGHVRKNQKVLWYLRLVLIGKGGGSIRSAMGIDRVG